MCSSVNENCTTNCAQEYMGIYVRFCYQLASVSKWVKSHKIFLIDNRDSMIDDSSDSDPPALVMPTMMAALPFVYHYKVSHYDLPMHDRSLSFWINKNQCGMTWRILQQINKTNNGQCIVVLFNANVWQK